MCCINMSNNVNRLNKTEKRCKLAFHSDHIGLVMYINNNDVDRSICDSHIPNIIYMLNMN